MKNRFRRMQEGDHDMMNRRKTWLLFLLGIAVLAVILLAASLPQLNFLPGQPFSLPDETPVESPRQSSGVDILSILFVVILAASGVLLIVVVIYLIISPEARKKMLRDMIALLLFAFLYYLVLRGKLESFSLEQEAETSGISLDALPQAPLAEFVADPPRWIIFATRFGLALLIATLVVGVIWFIWNRKRRRVSPLRQLAKEAQEALQAIEAGANLKDTVMRCYFEMGHILKEQRNIQRQDAMTPREFEKSLEETGLPSFYVQRLTRLFEKVRYGAKAAGKEDESQAIVCLRAIVDFCASSR
jgi:hypothetical protein